MKANRRYGLLKLCLVAWWVGMLSACGDDNYHYPSVKLEFVTVLSGDDGTIRTLIPDKGDFLSVSTDRTGSTISPNTYRRVLSNYETQTASDGTSTAVIYSLQSLVVPEPKSPSDPAFQGDFHCDPVDLTSIWMGRNYLNMILKLKASGNVQHTFGIGIEDETTEENDAGETEKVVTLSLYHDDGDDQPLYNRNVYLSVPLSGLVDEDHPDRTVRIRFKYTGSKGEVADKYVFSYQPE